MSTTSFLDYGINPICSYKDNEWKKGIELYEEATSEMKIVPDRGLYLTLMNCFALGKQSQPALELFMTMRSKNMASSTLYGYDLLSFRARFSFDTFLVWYWMHSMIQMQSLR